MEKENIIYQDAPGCQLHTLAFSQDSVFRREHFHNEIELVCVEEGQLLCLVSGETFLLKPGSILLIGRRVIHCLMHGNMPAMVSYIQIDMDSVCHTLFGDFSQFSCFSEENVKKYAIFPMDSELGQSFSFFHRELQEKRPHYRLAVKGGVYHLAAIMFREGLLADGSLSSGDGSYQKIRPALHYAQENYGEKVTLDSLCEFLKTDKYHFCKQFKKATGTTFFDYLTWIRLKQAENLLIQTNQTITEIALSCGFSSVQYFNRVFSTRQGCSPSAYRHMLGEQ